MWVRFTRPFAPASGGARATSRSSAPPALSSIRCAYTVSVNAGLVPGDPQALLVEEQVASLRTDALHRLGLTARETEVLRTALVIEDEAEIARELALSLRAVRERLGGLEAKLGVRTTADAVARARRESA